MYSLLLYVFSLLLSTLCVLLCLLLGMWFVLSTASAQYVSAVTSPLLFSLLSQ